MRISFNLSDPYDNAINRHSLYPELYVDSLPIPLFPKVFISVKDSKLLFIALSRRIISLCVSQLSQSALSYINCAVPSANQGGITVPGMA